MVLSQVASASSPAKRRLSERLLPPTEALVQSKVDANAPPEYPAFSSMARLLPLFISINANLSRSAAELVFALCDSDGKPLCSDCLCSCD